MRRETAVSAVILAAGRSTRLGRPKQLLDLGGQPVLAHVAANALAAPFTEVILVLGHDADRIRAALGDTLPSLRSVINPDYADGQSTSLRAGLAAVDPESAAALIMLGDQPEVDSDILAALIREFQTTQAAIVMPAYGGTPANPVLIARRLFPEAMAVEGDQGARQILRAHRAARRLIPFPDRHPPADIDTEDDYRSLLATWALRRSLAPRHRLAPKPR